MRKLEIWGATIDKSGIPEKNLEYLMQLPAALPSVEWVWGEMDRIWEAYDLDNRKTISGQAVGDFYSHPVWLMNGIFTMLDEVSAGHRNSIAEYFEQLDIKSVADYGGGFGELAIKIVKKMPETKVTIIEPYPSQVVLQRIQDNNRISLVSDLTSTGYDVVVAQDVLEHVEDPVLLAYKMAEAVKVGGKLVFANCFHPVIKCHLPITFHLRFTFPRLMRSMGLSYSGTIKGAEHIQVFERSHSICLKSARRTEKYSKVMGPVINSSRAMLSRVKRLFVH